MTAQLLCFACACLVSKILNGNGHDGNVMAMSCRVMADVPPVFSGSEPPVNNPKNYSLEKKPNVIALTTLAEDFSPKFSVQKGQKAVDKDKSKAGTCISIGFVKGKEGERCTIKTGRRNHHAYLKDCSGLPPLLSFVQDEDKVWYKVCSVGEKSAFLYKCLKIAKGTTLYSLLLCLSVCV